MSETFFEDLPSFSSFHGACDETYYHPAPIDWHIVIADVIGSTKAIEAGRYKDVNMVGAACITAAVNAAGDVKIPYVFGGDGATFLVPPALLDIVQRQLSAVKQFSEKMHGLGLRLGAVSVKEMLNSDKQIGVAKYRFETGAEMALFNGGGVSHADDLFKKDEKYLFDIAVNEKSEPALEGLSCRWQPLKAKKDSMMTILAMATHQGKEQDIYKETNNFILQCLESDAAPVSNENLTYKWPSLESLRQSKMVWRQGAWFKKLMQHIFEITLFNILNRFKIKLKALDVVGYKGDMIQNSDYRKFDDMLRMVVDVTKAQAEEIENHLKAKHEAGEVVYGTHYSDTALMTCFVQSLEPDAHIHFIDGNDGGYAIAARQLKQQL